VLVSIGALALWLGYIALDGVLFSRRYPPPPSSPVQGRITEISGDSRGLNLLQFETEAGERHEVRLDPEFDYGFDLRQLHQYQEQDRPVLTEFENNDGSARATAIKPV
jgi:hypothetical protein